MASRTSPIDLDAWLANTLGGAGNGNGTKMSVGKGLASGAYDFQNRLAARIPRGTLFDGITSRDGVGKFEIVLKCSNSNIGIGSGVKFWLKRATGTFTEYQVTAGKGGVPAGANISAYVSSAGPASGEWPSPATVDTNEASFEGTPTDGQIIRVAATDLGKWWYDNRDSVPNLILVGVAKDETATAQRCTFFTKDSTSKPYAELTESPGGTATNHPPDAPSEVDVDGDWDPIATGYRIQFTAPYNDADGDMSDKYEVVWIPD
jgi:hypothetical protein